jgi:hypothetical protein
LLHVSQESFRPTVPPAAQINHHEIGILLHFRNSATRSRMSLIYRYNPLAARSFVALFRYAVVVLAVCIRQRLSLIWKSWYISTIAEAIASRTQIVLWWNRLAPVLGNSRTSASRKNQYNNQQRLLHGLISSGSVAAPYAIICAVGSRSIGDNNSTH